MRVEEIELLTFIRYCVYEKNNIYIYIYIYILCTFLWKRVFSFPLYSRCIAVVEISWLCYQHFQWHVCVLVTIVFVLKSIIFIIMKNMIELRQ